MFITAHHKSPHPVAPMGCASCNWCEMSSGAETYAKELIAQF